MSRPIYASDSNTITPLFFLTGIDQFSPTQHWKTNATFGFTLEYFFSCEQHTKEICSMFRFLVFLVSREIPMYS